jgi:hypothetical protein
MLLDLQARGAAQEPAVAPHQPQQLNPAEQRARSRMPPLIEYAATVLYVIVGSQEGELHLSPDSGSGLTGWPRSPLSASSGNLVALPPTGTPTVRDPRALGEPIASSTSIVTSIVSESRIA